ncbi:MAG: HYR domain-containing protein [Pyrinomonadaceae bacterium]
MKALFASSSASTNPPVERALADRIASGTHSIRRARSLTLFMIFGLIALAAMAFSSSATALLHHKEGASVQDANRSKSALTGITQGKDGLNKSGLEGYLFPAAKSSLWPRLVVETIATYAADCTTPKSDFVLGETVCAQTDGVDLGFPGGRWVHWIRPDLSIAYGGSGTTDITTNPQTFSFMPDVAGTWKVSIAETGDDSQTPAIFTVSAAPLLATYNSTCTTTQSSFTLGNTVCARVTGVDPTLNRRLFWIDPAGNLRAQTAITSDPQTDQFVLPATETSIIGNDVVDNRGPWKVSIVSSRGSAVFNYIFNVAGPDPTADLGVAKAIVGENPDAGTNFSFFVAVTNYGPSAAANVVFSDPQPINATFVSITQTSGPSFNCDGNNPVVCTLASLAAGQTAEFEIVYTAGSSGTITNIATIDSDTEDLNTANNTGSYGPFTINDGGGGGDPTCSLNCPGDQTVTATSGSGAIVNFSGDVEVSGTCGQITFNPASGSQFPVGTTPVTVTSAEGGGSCTFNVIVINRAAPTIQCPLPTLSGVAPAGETETNVSVSTPSATGENLTVTGVRGDNRAISDPYPVGTTVITWTATDDNGTLDVADDRTASCSQTVNVTSNDAPTISCPSNKTFTISDCTSYTATAAEIGTPSTTGNGVTVASRRSDDLPLTDPYPVGTTVITWTATDDVGRVVSCTHTITVNSTGDSTPPTLTVPPNVSATTSTCTALLDDELGVATAEDSCSTVTITRSGVPTFTCPIPGDPNHQCESFVFPTGTTIITYTAKDASNNTTTGTQTVTVTEDPAVAPTISAPGDVTLYTGPGATSCGVTVSDLDATLGTATANDNCPGVVVTRSGVPSGNVFPVGNTTITYIATDRSGNTATDTQVVTVVDNTVPVVTPPVAVTLYTGPGATSCGVTVTDLDGTFGTGSATDNCPGVGAVTRSGVPAGGVFPVGDTTLTYSATDAHGNTGSATQVVTVVDNTQPVISCPANITIEPTCPTGAIATYTTPTATDNCGVQSVVRTAGPASGSVFPIGTTTVTHVATDIYGNTSSCSFTVTVLTPQAVIQNLQAAVNASSLTGTQKNGLLAKLSAALQAINNGQINVACNKLAEFNNSVGILINNGSLSAATGNAWISSANHVRNTIGCTNLPCS